MRDLLNAYIKKIEIKIEIYVKFFTVISRLKF